MQLQQWMRYGTLLILLAVAVGACEESTGPAAEFDAQQTAQAMQDMVGAVNGDEMVHAMASLGLASSLFESGPAAAMAAEPLNPTVGVVQSAALLSAAEFFPAEILGVTFVWGEAEQAYVPSELDGAPEDGIRIIYYAVDPVTGQPATPLNPLGYVDLRDLSTLSSLRLGVVVMSTSGESEVRLADYYLDLAYTLTQSSLSVDIASTGYLSNGVDRLNFDIAQSMLATDTEVSISQDFSLALEGTDRAMSFNAMVTADPQSTSETPETLEATALITGDGQSVGLEVSWANDVLDGSLSHNGDLVVLIGGTLDEPTFTDPAGDPLTEEELNALGAVWEAIGDMLDFVEELFGFAE